MSREVVTGDAMRLDEHYTITMSERQAQWLLGEMRTRAHVDAHFGNHWPHEIVELYQYVGDLTSWGPE